MRVSTRGTHIAAESNKAMRSTEVLLMGATYWRSRGSNRNTLYAEAVISSTWPIFSDRTIVSNYNPVILTSVIWKVFESIIMDYLISYQPDNDHICELQIGFMQDRSTSLHLLNVLND